MLIQIDNEDDALFRHGRTLLTPGVLEKISLDTLPVILGKHVTGDFGEEINSDDHDRTLNEQNIRHLKDRVPGNYRIHSSYRVMNRNGNFTKVWIITEGTRDNLITTVLLPEEY